MGVTPDDAQYPALRDQFLAYYAAELDRTTALFDGMRGMGQLWQAAATVKSNLPLT